MTEFFFLLDNRNSVGRFRKKCLFKSQHSSPQKVNPQSDQNCPHSLEADRSCSTLFHKYAHSNAVLVAGRACLSCSDSSRPLNKTRKPRDPRISYSLVW